MVALAVARAAHGTPTPAAATARVVRLTTEALEVWSVSGSGGAANLEVQQPLTGQIQKALGVAKVCLVDAAVVGEGATGGSAGTGEGGVGVESAASVTNWGLDLLVLAAAGGDEGGGEGGALSVHAVRVSSEEASWVGSSVAVKVGGDSWPLPALRV